MMTPPSCYYKNSGRVYFNKEFSSIATQTWGGVVCAHGAWLGQAAGPPGVLGELGKSTCPSGSEPVPEADCEFYSKYAAYTPAKMAAGGAVTYRGPIPPSFDWGAPGCTYANNGVVYFNTATPAQMTAVAATTG